MQKSAPNSTRHAAHATGKHGQLCNGTHTRTEVQSTSEQGVEGWRWPTCARVMTLGVEGAEARHWPAQQTDIQPHATAARQAAQAM